ncbi:cbb3-type cytochrome c oxidase subunit I [Natrinema thermotolerans]|uniref:Cbb3-type cytochrome c oxidase subunit I n=1 Tax=Natrinema thermotolerans TaxID=121872 RepID=A0AAF0PFT3_9EURY|nr:cbb3-type cytochrome c oxidase subunit I [Natrinema thermotolerans]QCC58755.1 cytochrome B [Natrinema thermotolerans]WMT09911.1 cbb3-type cytochrome c oxidase subunit I [Natrinema thermotolerans]
MQVTRKQLATFLATIFVVNLIVMGGGAWLSYANSPDIPDTIVGPDGETVATSEDVQDGKAVFQENGLMNQGSILGRGSYYDTDYTADTLDSKAEYMRDYYAQERHDENYSALNASVQAGIDQQVRQELQGSEYGSQVQYSAAEVYAHQQVREDYVERYHEGDRERGIPAGQIESAEEAEEFADFALWTAWISHTDRPDSSASFTNDWPYSPAAGNDAGGPIMTWSVIAMVLLVGGAGAAIWLYQSIDLPEPEAEGASIPHPSEIELTPSQLLSTRFVLIGALLFVAQTFLGGLLAHYYIERDGFFGMRELIGVDILQWLPWSIVRTWHVDLGILWIATMWLGAGLFLAPLLTGREPPKQALYVKGLVGALLVVAVGGLAGIWLGINNFFDGQLWWLLGNEGLEYVEIGRIWQVGLLVGFLGWTALVARGFKPLLDREPRYGLAHMIVYAGGSIGLLFMAGFLYTPKTNIVVTEFWRWWVVHMWVEGVFEFFILVVIALTLVSMNLLSKKSAEKAVIFQAALVMGSGIIGVSHHYWWAGLPEVWLPIGSVFSTIEFIPLLFILYEALGQYRAMDTAGKDFPYRMAFYFIVASSVWNFFGAGVIGFFINLPIISYYETGTYLTVAHAHGAMFGAFGLLAMGMSVYILRVTTRAESWTTRRLRWSFWLCNLGLALMIFLSLLPVGFLQLEVGFTQGYAASRSLEFYNGELIQTLFWLRMPGDTMLIAGAVLFAWDVVAKLLFQRKATAGESSSHVIADRIFGDSDPSDVVDPVSDDD